ncbi:MAG: exonuclease SbcCD subunit D [Eubacteriales bacterium]|nr:exonuclease SbcCD subunit D [Eubacteriales bacterium]
MKLIHLSDLHLGKRVNEFSMLEDQEYILTQILRIVRAERPDAVLIAGDVYDKSSPSAEAVRLFDDFLYELSCAAREIFVVSGNHDSPERIAFGGRLMDRQGVRLCPVYAGEVTSATMEDGYGPVHIYMLPFLKPAHVRRYFPEERIESYTDALRLALSGTPREPEERNVLIAHQFVAGALRTDSEEISVGGSDQVDVSVFDRFDYVALGHLHGAQSAGRDTVRYCGTPLKYSFSEAKHEKSVTVAELAEKGSVSIRTVPLVPRRDLREIRGTYMEVTAREFYEGSATDDYLHITLTDEEDVPDAVGRLRAVYPNLMKLDYDNRRTRAGVVLDGGGEVRRRTPLSLLEEFYEKQNNRPMSEEQERYAQGLIREIWEGDA